ncbi:hypothetical protein MN608_10873 [Microdochium nivale]|nr:hypothetical protein MN608_10873 [Microdochium nivale]
MIYNFCVLDHHDNAEPLLVALDETGRVRVSRADLARATYPLLLTCKLFAAELLGVLHHRSQSCSFQLIDKRMIPLYYAKYDHGLDVRSVAQPVAVLRVPWPGSRLMNLTRILLVWELCMPLLAIGPITFPVRDLFHLLRETYRSLRWVEIIARVTPDYDFHHANLPVLSLMAISVPPSFVLENLLEVTEDDMTLFLWRCQFIENLESVTFIGIFRVTWLSQMATSFPAIKFRYGRRGWLLERSGAYVQFVWCD